MGIRQKTLRIDALERIDQRCAAFEEGWQRGEPRPIESLLDGVADDERDVLLAELIVLEWDYRVRRGESPTRQEYLERFQAEADVVNDALHDAKPRAGSFEPPSIADLSQRFPSLQITALLGAGGMAAVYKARQPGLDRWVAVKVLPKEHADDARFALRFTREARTLARLTHPNIVGLYEFGKVDDTYYFLMEYVDGTTLREVVAAGQLKPEQALMIVPQLCDALQYAHEKGVIHRDIKPENILLGKDGSVKIADFGLSRILGTDTEASPLTRTHQVMGTPRYMAPEQLQGSHGVDHRADIYSLGVVFYEMLTGELPVGRFAPPSQKVHVDVRLDDVVLRTLESEPQHRYQRASQIKSDVQSITSTQRPADAVTRLLDEAGSQTSQGASLAPSLQQQELAARLLVSRRELMDRVQASLRPLFRWQVLQLLLGILFVALGAWCWAPNTHLPHRLASGLLLHAYGLLLIGSAANVCTKISRVDTSAPVEQIRSMLSSVRRGYLRFAPVIGFAWWLLWIPVAVAIGFDPVLHPNSLIPSLIVGVVGIAASLWLYRHALRSEQTGAKAWRTRLAGKSLSAAETALDEIEKAAIR